MFLFVFVFFSSGGVTFSTVAACVFDCFVAICGAGSGWVLGSSCLMGSVVLVRFLVLRLLLVVLFCLVVWL